MKNNTVSLKRLCKLFPGCFKNYVQNPNSPVDSDFRVSGKQERQVFDGTIELIEIPNPNPDEYELLDNTYSAEFNLIFWKKKINKTVEG